MEFINKFINSNTQPVDTKRRALLKGFGALSLMTAMPLVACETAERIENAKTNAESNSAQNNAQAVAPESSQQYNNNCNFIIEGEINTPTEVASKIAGREMDYREYVNGGNQVFEERNATVTLNPGQPNEVTRDYRGSEEGTQYGARINYLCP